MFIDTGTSSKSNTEPIDLVYINDFDDTYNEYEEEKARNELEREARKIRRRYRNINEYNYALNIFCQYMAELSISYGQRELFNAALRSGAIKDFIPPFPRLKMTKLNKKMLKKGIRDSIGDGKLISSPEDVEMLIRAYMGDEEYIDPNETVLYNPIPVHKTKILEDELDDVKDETGMRSDRRMSEIDYLEEYFRAKNIMKSKKSSKKKKEDDELSGSDWFYGNYSSDDVEEKENEVVWYEGSLLSGKEIEDVKVMRMLKTLGWDSIKMMRGKTGTVSSVRHMKNVDKMEKKAKKKKEKTDNFLTKILTDNSFDSFEDFEDAMLDFTFGGDIDVED